MHEAAEAATVTTQMKTKKKCTYAFLTCRQTNKNAMTSKLAKIGSDHAKSVHPNMPFQCLCK